MNFDHLTPEQREEQKKDILKLNKPDENWIDGVASAYPEEYKKWLDEQQKAAIDSKPRPNIPEKDKAKYRAMAMRMIYEGQIDNEVRDKNGDLISFNEAKEQILRNDLAKAAQLRDEYKMQLDAANKEIKILNDAILFCSGSCRNYKKLPKAIIPMIKKDFPDIVQSEITLVNKESDKLKKDFEKLLKENKEYRELIEKEREEAFQEVKKLKEEIDDDNKELNCAWQKVIDLEEKNKVLLNNCNKMVLEYDQLLQENKALKNDKEYWKEQFDEVTEFLHTLKKEYEERLEEQKKVNIAWRNSYDSEVHTNNELLKEVLSLRELKKENVDLIEQVANLQKEKDNLKEHIDKLDESYTEIFKICEAHIGSDNTLGYTLVGAVKNLIEHFNQKIDNIRSNRDSYEVKYIQCEREANDLREVNDQLRRQLAGAQDTIVALRKLREEEKEMDKSFLSDSDRFKLTQHECTVNWLNETEKRLADAHLEIRELKQALEVFKDIVKKNDYKNAIVNELYNTHLYTKELEDDPWLALHKIVCWHSDTGAYFQKEKTWSKRIKNFYYDKIYSAFWNAYNTFRWGKHNDKWPEF